MKIHVYSSLANMPSLWKVAGAWCTNKIATDLKEQKKERREKNKEKKTFANGGSLVSDLARRLFLLLLLLLFISSTFTHFFSLRLFFFFFLIFSVLPLSTDLRNVSFTGFYAHCFFHVSFDTAITAPSSVQLCFLITFRFYSGETEPVNNTDNSISRMLYQILPRILSVI